MKKWTMRVTGNEPITPQDLIAVALIGVVLGAIILWWIFARLLGYQAFECTEKAANWIAAVGTWIVGFAAAAIAYFGHDLKLRDRRAQRLDKIKNQMSHMQAIIMTARNLTFAMAAIDGYFRRRPLEQQTSSMVAQLAKDARGIVPDIAWSDNQKMVSEAQVLVHMLRIDVERQKFVGLLDSIAMQPENPYLLTMLTESSSMLLEEASALQKAARADLNCIKERHDRLEVRVKADAERDLA